MNHNDLVISKITGAFPDAIEETGMFRDELTVTILQEYVHGVCKLLRDDEDLKYNFIIDIVGDDYLPEYPRFAVSYHLRSMGNVHDFRLRTMVEDPDEGPKTIGDLWKIATWLEMEVYDLMGISFEGNGSQRRLFLPEDWVGHPLRKDYPLGYEEVQFSFNYDAIQEKKPYAGRRQLGDES
ncbi:MAG: NADH-quinone oxidoreductase subunit C [Chloroflexota bacterium]